MKSLKKVMSITDRRRRFLSRALISVFVVSVLACFLCVGVSAAETQAAESSFQGPLSEFVKLLVGGISDIAGGIGSGVNDYVKDLFLSADGSGLSTFGGVVAIFGGIALAIGLTTLIFNWIRSIGN